ncbi:MAG: cbb3-type cytochrome c oxidase subunit I [Nitrospirae bacterium]|nr:cbb3-type cytochrome c oxidase subunit I [Nitrospirota bacterium]
MDRFVKNFIGMSIIYLFIASLFGVAMLASPPMVSLKFVHSHLNLLGWVSMMIYGVGYHILPRFTGKPLKSPKLGEIQFWLANIGLIGMLFFYVLESTNPETGVYKTLTVVFGLVEALSVFLFFYNMLATIYAKSEE